MGVGRGAGRIHNIQFVTMSLDIFLEFGKFKLQIFFFLLSNKANDNSRVVVQNNFLIKYFVTMFDT